MLVPRRPRSGGWGFYIDEPFSFLGLWVWKVLLYVIQENVGGDNIFCTLQRN